MPERLKSVLRMIWGVIRVSWWAILLAIAVALLVMFRRKRQAESIDIEDVIGDRQMTFSSSAREKVSQAMADIRIDKAISGEKSAAERRKLDEIRQMKDKQARLDKLASYLKKNL